MSLIIRPTAQSEITHLVCPECREKVPRVGIKKGSNVKGLTWKCRRCGELWEVFADNELQKENKK